MQQPLQPTRPGAAPAEGRRPEDEVRLLVSLAASFAQAEDFRTALQEMLRAFCVETGWAVGQAWCPNGDGETLGCALAWHASTDGFEAYREESLRWTFEPGHGFPGHVWVSRTPEIVRDVNEDERFARGDVARQVGLRGAMFVPVLAGDEVVAVLEFLVREPRERDEALLRLVSAVASHLGALVRRKRAEEAHRCECNFCEAVLQTVGALVVVLDAEGRIVRFNRACERLTGWMFEEVRGRSPWDLLVPTDEVEDARTGFDRLRLGGGAEESVGTWVARDGQRRRIAWTHTVLAGSDGEASSVIATGLDVTDRRRMEDRLRLSQRLESVGRLAGGVAHDFNNLLSAILGYGSLVMKSLAMDDPLRRDVEEIQRAAERGADITRQLVAFSREQTLRPQLVNLNDLVAELEPMLRRLIGEDIKLLAVPSPDLGRTLVDPGQTKQLLINLVLNSREAMEDGGYVTIKTRSAEVGGPDGEPREGLKPGPYVVLSVVDTGKGIDPNDLPRIFDPFFTTREGGSGLGLAMAHGFVLQSGGDIFVQTERGRGTRFDIFLPRSAAASAAPIARNARPEWGGHETILLVEDDPFVRDMTRRTFEEVGYRVLEAVNGEEAIGMRRGSSAPIHLVVTDLVLPGMTGAELAGQLRGDGQGPPVLFMSAHDETAPIRRGIAAAQADFVAKPFDPNLLLRKVREMLDARTS